MPIGKRLLLPLCLLWLLLWGVGLGAVEAPQLKAAFLLNFAKFTQWPDPAAESISVCFATVAEPVGAALAKLGETRIREGSLVVRRGVRLRDMTGCRIVFLGAADEHLRRELLDRLRQQPTLTLSDLAGFAEEGGMIELFLDEGRLRFIINLSAIKQADLEVSARLLGLARGVIRE